MNRILFLHKTSLRRKGHPIETPSCAISNKSSELSQILMKIEPLYVFVVFFASACVTTTIIALCFPVFAALFDNNFFLL